MHVQYPGPNENLTGDGAARGVPPWRLAFGVWRSAFGVRRLGRIGVSAILWREALAPNPGLAGCLGFELALKAPGDARRFPQNPTHTQAESAFLPFLPLPRARRLIPQARD